MDRSSVASSPRVANFAAEWASLKVRRNRNSLWASTDNSQLHFQSCDRIGSLNALDLPPYNFPPSPLDLDFDELFCFYRQGVESYRLKATCLCPSCLLAKAAAPSSSITTTKCSKRLSITPLKERAPYSQLPAIGVRKLRRCGSI